MMTPRTTEPGSATETEQPLLDQVEAEIQKPGYSILRGWLAIHGGASARIVLEEITALTRALAAAVTARETALRQEVQELRSALALFAPGSHDGLWGRIKAFLVEGAPSRKEGIRIARLITEWQVAIPASAYALEVDEDTTDPAIGKSEDVREVTGSALGSSSSSDLTALREAPTSLRLVWVMERRLTTISDDMRRVPAGTLVYWDGGHAESFTEDVNHAVQWCRREDALRCTSFTKNYAQWHWQIVEHGFVCVDTGGTAP